MIFPSHAMDVEIINKNLQELIHVLSKHLCHGSKKHTGNTFHPKWHNILVKEFGFSD
jgi:hypothetical protein